MVTVRETQKGVEIDFTSTMFFHEMMLVPSEKRDELVKLVAEKNNSKLFEFLLNNIGAEIFCFVK